VLTVAKALGVDAGHLEVLTISEGPDAGTIISLKVRSLENAPASQVYDALVTQLADPTSAIQLSPLTNSVAVIDSSDPAADRAAAATGEDERHKYTWLIILLLLALVASMGALWYRQMLQRRRKESASVDELARATGLPRDEFLDSTWHDRRMNESPIKPPRPAKAATGLDDGLLPRLVSGEAEDGDGDDSDDYHMNDGDDVVKGKLDLDDVTADNTTNADNGNDSYNGADANNNNHDYKMDGGDTVDNANQVTGRPFISLKQFSVPLQRNMLRAPAPVPPVSGIDASKGTNKTNKQTNKQTAEATSMVEEDDVIYLGGVASNLQAYMTPGTTATAAAAAAAATATATATVRSTKTKNNRAPAAATPAEQQLQQQAANFQKEREKTRQQVAYQTSWKTFDPATDATAVSALTGDANGLPGAATCGFFSSSATTASTATPAPQSLLGKGGGASWAKPSWG
jgi:hypothetical protein